MPDPLSILQQYWNHPSFRPPQEEIIQSILKGNDTLALLPTGGGKSVCFQIPALIKDGICIVVSPLVALIRNQVDQLQERGIKAVALTGGLSRESVERILDNCLYGNYKFLYLSPERLQQELVQERIKRMAVNVIAIDEAHCISQWGHDFRPAYRNCGVLRTFFPGVPTVALTASATQRVVNDICESLGLQNPTIVRKSFARPNLAYLVFEEEDKPYKAAHILKKNRGSSIVYVQNRKATSQIAAYFNKEGIAAAFYHGGIAPEEKNLRLKQWMDNTVQVMVATNAFGMGIDKPDVRTVIHVELPENIENYYQEAGRAGRDGKKAFAIMLKNKNDGERVKERFLETLPDVDFIKLLYRKLNNYFQIPYGEGENAVVGFNFTDFCHTYHFQPALAYNGLKLLDRCAVLNFAESFHRNTSLQCVTSPQRLLVYLNTHPETKMVTQALLRTYGGLFDGEVSLDLRLISTKTGVPEVKIAEVLQRLHRDGMALYVAQQTDAEITFLLPREDEKTIHRIAPYIQQQHKVKSQQVQAIIEYANNDKVCKSVQLAAYFGETDGEPCGICSVCLASKTAMPPEVKRLVQEAILETIRSKPLSSRALLGQLPYKELHVLETLRTLLEAEKIEVTPRNEYRLREGEG